MKFKPAASEYKKDKAIKAIEPNCLSEFEIQALIWAGLRALGINARGEVSCAFSGRAKVRFDIAVFSNGELAGIIEIKKSPIKHKSTWEETRQGERYLQFGVPVLIVYGESEAQELLSKAKNGSLFK